MPIILTTLLKMEYVKQRMEHEIFGLEELIIKERKRQLKEKQNCRNQRHRRTTKKKQKQ